MGNASIFHGLEFFLFAKIFSLMTQDASEIMAHQN